MRKWTLIVLAFAAALAAGNAPGATVQTYLLNQANDLVDLTAPPPYGTVTLTWYDGIGESGNMDFSVALNEPPFEAGTNYGLQSFGFNFDGVVLTAANITAPTGWSVNIPGGNQDGFGAFDVVLSTTGQGRLDPLTFSIAVAGDSFATYEHKSTGTAGQGNQYFAGHVTGFTAQDCIDGSCTSVYIGGSDSGGGQTEVPLPGAVWLFGSALVGLVTLSRRRRVA